MRLSSPEQISVSARWWICFPPVLASVAIRRASAKAFDAAIGPAAAVKAAVRYCQARNALDGNWAQGKRRLRHDSERPVCRKRFSPPSGLSGG
jgi:hypothetical protein